MPTDAQPNQPTPQTRRTPVERLAAWLAADERSLLPGRPCNYLPEQVARERAFQTEQLDPATYHELMDRGFRRSGSIFYAMECPRCRLCVPLRVPVATFTPTRSQRRVLRRNADVAVQVRRPECTPASFAIYRRYLSHQHGKPEIDEGIEQFRASLYAQVVDTWEVVYSVGERPVAISLVDVSERSVSAVYHFYEPDQRARSLGVFSVLAEIEWTRQLGVPFYYLGYWIEGCKTMAYKANYGPHEVLMDGVWRPV